jgi:Protein of unknown function (DUF2281)
MSTITEEIIEDLKELPLEMQTEALDFIKFLKQKLEKNNTQLTASNGILISELLEQAAHQNLFSSINSPIEWQHEIRQDRILEGRE